MTLTVVPDAAARYDRTTVRWGRGSAMTAYEAALWHASDCAMLRAAGVVVEVLDVTPAWERLVSGHRWALARVPRLRQRVRSDPLRLGPPAWADVRVDLDHHLRRVRLSPGATLADALEVAARLHEETFDPARPLWLATLVEGLPDGRSAYLLKLHHAMAEDHELVALFELLHSRVREPTTTPPLLPPGRHETGTPLGLSARHAAGAPLTAARAAATTVRTGLAAARRPARAALGALRGARAVSQAIGAVAGTRGSPLLHARGAHRAFEAIDLPTARLREAGLAAGGRPGDAMLAAVLDALGRYHEAHGAPADELHLAVPLPVRRDGRGDRPARARISMPAGPMPPPERIALVRARIAEAEERPAADLLRAMAPAASRTPTAVLGAALARSTRPLALQAFTVRGLDRDAFLAGGRVLRMFSFGPTSGCALSATLVTHQEHSCIGLNLDTAAITDPELFGRCLRTALDQLLGAAPGAGRR